ncbi:acyl carrier protein [Fodinibius sp. SL11]|uniref:acyl carrier protein n=1 Tax=Fodinibius sp. SL11 TaxID=3425690 RepID=UPI003F8831C2
MSDNIDTIIKKHLHRVAPEADLNQLQPDDELGPTLDLDSMDFYSMMVGISEELRIEIPEEEYGKLRTFNDIKNFLSKSAREV